MLVFLFLTTLVGLVTAAGFFSLLIYDYYTWRHREQGLDLLIRIVDRQGKKLNVSPGMLESLLARNEISRFRRANGWVKIGIDTTRSPQTVQVYAGQERRWA